MSRGIFVLLAVVGAAMFSAGVLLSSNPSIGLAGIGLSLPGGILLGSGVVGLTRR